LLSVLPLFGLRGSTVSHRLLQNIAPLFVD
jgi:hypothetical protein